jgi:hypothetical protein
VSAERPAHIDGRPVSAYTYGTLGCRCVGCTAAATDDRGRKSRAARGGEALRVQYRVQVLTVAWARKRMTDADREAVLAQAYADAGVERVPRGHHRRRAAS